MAKRLRDISKDIEVRIKEIHAEKDELTERIGLLERLIESFTVALDHEKKRGIKQLALPIQAESKHQTSGNIVRLVTDILSDQQEWNLARIAEAVKSRGADFGNKNPNRVVHFALVGMKRQGLAEIIHTGVWKATLRLLEQTKSESKTGEVPTTKS